MGDIILSGSSSSGGGGGGAVTIANGADVAEGNTADVAWSGSGSGTVVAILKKIATSGSGGGPGGTATASGTVAVNGDTVVIATSGYSVVSIQRTANTAFDGTLNMEGSTDGGTTWNVIRFIYFTSGPTGSPVVTNLANSAFGGALQLQISVAGYDHFRVRVSNATTGSATYQLTASQGDVFAKFVNTQIVDGANNTTNAAAVTNANALKVDGSNVTQPVSGTVTTSPPSHASTNVDQIGGAALTEGQKAMAASVPVVIASDQSAVPVSGTVTTSPPSHASTNVDQIGGASITEGQKAMAASVPVVIASDQSAVPVSGTVTTSPPSHASTNVDQVGGAALTEGQTTMANSIPVVIASNQSTIPVSGTIGVTNVAQETGGNLASINTNLLASLVDQQQVLDQLLSDIRMELRIMNALFTQAFNIRDELDSFRMDPYYASSGYNGVS